MKYDPDIEDYYEYDDNPPEEDLDCPEDSDEEE